MLYSIQHYSYKLFHLLFYMYFITRSTDLRLECCEYSYIYLYTYVCLLRYVHGDSLVYWSVLVLAYSRFDLLFFVSFAIIYICKDAIIDSIESPWRRRGRIRPQHPLACRKRRLNGAACLPWAATRVA